MQCEVQSVVEVVVQVGSSTDYKVNQTSIHELYDATAESSWRHGSSNRDSNRRIVIGIEHAVGINSARL